VLLPAAGAGHLAAAAVPPLSLHLLLDRPPRIRLPLPRSYFPSPLSPFARATAARSSARPPPRRRRGELSAGCQGLIFRTQYHYQSSYIPFPWFFCQFPNSSLELHCCPSLLPLRRLLLVVGSHCRPPIALANHLTSFSSLCSSSPAPSRSPILAGASLPTPAVRRRLRSLWTAHLSHPHTTTTPQPVPFRPREALQPLS
jgi:hypothetical protein